MFNIFSLIGGVPALKVQDSLTPRLTPDLDHRLTGSHRLGIRLISFGPLAFGAFIIFMDVNVSYSPSHQQAFDKSHRMLAHRPQ